MKNLGLIAITSFVSALLAIFVYRMVEEPQKILIKETLPAKQVDFNYQDEVVKKVKYNSPTNAANPNFVDAAQAVTPTVVNIKATEKSDYFWSGGNYGASTGSGVIISRNGYIVTNRHVIDDGDKIEVTLNDKREFVAEVIGTDPSTDLALLKIKATDLPFLGFGNSDKLSVGEWVLAVGNPFNLESTVTAGIVSAKGRNINILEGDYTIESFIQTDAAVNPGNSGGALVNSIGELIGINTAIITRSGRYEGYSFAVPSNLASKVISDLREYGEVQRAILGVNIEPIDNKLAESLKLPSVEGVHIKEITKGGSADLAKLKPGDVIVSINGKKTSTMPELQEQIGGFRPGDMISVQYYRKGKMARTKITLKNRNNSIAMSANHRDEFLLELGFELRDLAPSEERRVPLKGVKVTSIYRGSKIERTEMDPDYIITKVNDIRVKNLKETVEALKEAKDKVLLEGFYENYPGEYYYTFSKRK